MFVKDATEALSEQCTRLVLFDPQINCHVGSKVNVDLVSKTFESLEGQNINEELNNRLKGWHAKPLVGLPSYAEFINCKLLWKFFFVPLMMSH